jgi:hypothetical protein
MSKRHNHETLEDSPKQTARRHCDVIYEGSPSLPLCYRYARLPSSRADTPNPLQQRRNIAPSRHCRCVALQATMGDSNILVSNGTCYSSAGNKLDSSFIPCGNDAFGHQTCCGAGDNCMADNACFGVHGSGYGSFLTYMGGCTDPEYKDASCPDKHGIGR